MKSIDKLVEKGKMTLDYANDAMGKIEFTTDMDALRDVDFVVEAVIENIDLKKDLYTSLGEICKPEIIFASNTSSLSIGGTYDVILIWNESFMYNLLRVIGFIRTWCRKLFCWLHAVLPFLYS
jgi:hypothetical protein